MQLRKMTVEVFCAKNQQATGIWHRVPRQNGYHPQTHRMVLLADGIENAKRQARDAHPSALYLHVLKVEKVEENDGLF